MCVLLTFDDGLKSQYENALEILEKYNIKAIFFIPTKIIELKSKEEMEFFSIKNIH
ncbi:MAG: polysaccharide deacetylase family protein [candidate division WOR-3 bacterium]